VAWGLGGRRRVAWGPGGRGRVAWGLVRGLEDDADLLSSRLGVEGVGEGRGCCGVWGQGRGRGSGGIATGVECGLERALDHLAAVDLQGGQRAEGGGELGGVEGAGLFCGLALEHLGGEGGDGDRSLAAEGLEGGLIDDAATILFLELEPESHHVAAVGAAGGADGIGVGEFAEILGIGERLMELGLVG